MGLPKSTNVRFDNLTPQFEIPSTTVTYNLINNQTSSQRTSIVASGATAGKNGYIFPLPVNFNYKKYFMWNQKDHDFIKDKVASFLASTSNTVAKSNSLEDAASGVLSQFKDATSSMFDSLKKMNAESGVDAALYLAQKKYGADIDMINYNRDKAVNPLRKLYFQGMDLRTFDFSFDLIPQNESENNKFLQAYRQLKSAATPIINAGDIFYQYPCKFRVDITVNNRTIFSLGNLRCVNAGFNINDMRFREDGLPMVYNISLTFQESEIADQSVESSSGLLI